MRRPPLVPWLLVAVVVGVVSALYWGTGPCDDDYIVYRYAQNLADGRGLVFNPGERVEGFTCPLWVLLIAGALKTGIAPALASQLLGVASVLAAAGLALVPRERGGARSEAALGCALAIATSAALAYHAAQGLGTALAAALIAGGYVSTARAEHGGGTYRLPALLFALAALVRPETLLFLPAFLWAVPRERRPVAGGIALAVVGGWTLFRLAYYGEWLPMTWYAKKLPLADDLAYGARYLGQATLDTGLLLLLGVCAFARWRRFALLERSSTAALAGVGLAVAGVLWVGGDYMWLARFCVPVLPVLLMLTAQVLERVAAQHALGARAGWIACVVFAAWPAVHLPDLRTSHEYYEERWIAIGRELARRAPPGCRIATSPIGAIGFHSGLRIVDMLGITNPVIRRAAPDLEIKLKGHQRYDAEWVLAQDPDVVLLGNGEMPPGKLSLTVSAWERSLFLHPRFQELYSARVVEVEGSYPLPYFQRRGGFDLRDSTSVPLR